MSHRCNAHFKVSRHQLYVLHHSQEAQNFIHPLILNFLKNKNKNKKRLGAECEICSKWTRYADKYQTLPNFSSSLPCDFEPNLQGVIPRWQAAFCRHLEIANLLRVILLLIILTYVRPATAPQRFGTCCCKARSDSYTTWRSGLSKPFRDKERKNEGRKGGEEGRERGRG